MSNQSWGIDVSHTAYGICSSKFVKMKQIVAYFAQIMVISKVKLNDFVEISTIHDLGYLSEFIW